MLRFKTQPNPNSALGVYGEYDDGILTINFTRTYQDGNEQKTENAGSVVIQAENLQDLETQLKHAKWGIGKILKQGMSSIKPFGTQSSRSASKRGLKGVEVEVVGEGAPVQG